jgi:ATP-dependent protease ClpP protease subunit
MTTAVLKIYGDIGESNPLGELFDGVEMISAKMVSDFLDKRKNTDQIIVRINSRGGDVQEGWAIHDLLVNSGKKIKTIGEGKIYSIATIVFLAGEEREIMSNADGLIHNPYIPPYTLADQYESEDLIRIAESLKQEEEKILDFYASRTGAEPAKLAEYMKEDTKLSARDMLDLGFATKIIEPVQAYAYYKPNISKMTENDVKTFGQKLDSILDKIKNFTRLPVTDQTITDKDGKEFTLQKEEGSPAVGDKANPDGSFVMSDGRTIVIEGGVITKIEEAAADPDELAKAQARIAELETVVSELEKAKTDYEAKQAELTEKENALKDEEVKVAALAKELQGLKNTWKPDSRTKFSSAEKVGDVNIARVRELHEKIKNQKSE